MFTGIIEEVGRVTGIAHEPPSYCRRIASREGTKKR